MKRIKISAVNELASFVLSDLFYERRDLILIWLKRQGISVYGKRTRYFENDYKELEKRMEKFWKKS